jgi:hypothetical protein
MEGGREEILWSVMTSIFVLARFCAPSLELQIAESWSDRTALDDLLGVHDDKINDDRLCGALEPFSHVKISCADIFKNVTANSLARPSISCSPILPLHIWKEMPMAIPRQKGDTARTAVPTAPRFASALWQRRRGCP